MRARSGIRLGSERIICAEIRCPEFLTAMILTGDIIRSAPNLIPPNVASILFI